MKLLFASGDNYRLAVCFTGEFGSVHIGYPDLNGPHTSLP